jgi:hypothetical protein
MPLFKIYLDLVKDSQRMYFYPVLMRKIIDKHDLKWQCYIMKQKTPLFKAGFLKTEKN